MLFIKLTGKDRWSIGEERDTIHPTNFYNIFIIP